MRAEGFFRQPPPGGAALSGGHRPVTVNNAIPPPTGSRSQPLPVTAAPARLGTGPVTNPGRARPTDRLRACVLHILRGAMAARQAPRPQTPAARCSRNHLTGLGGL